ncbi:MAG: conjugal transfer protein TraS, partial [Burkholderiales bacterium]|nr:conjugal transfer protein TraS [Burkholderiales bacterium]
EAVEAWMHVGRALAMSGDPADRNLAKSIAAFVRDMPSTPAAEPRRQAPEPAPQVKPADIGPQR